MQKNIRDYWDLKIYYFGMLFLQSDFHIGEAFDAKLDLKIGFGF